MTDSKLIYKDYDSGEIRIHTDNDINTGSYRVILKNEYGQNSTDLEIVVNVNPLSYCANMVPIPLGANKTMVMSSWTGWQRIHKFDLVRSFNTTPVGCSNFDVFVESIYHESTLLDKYFVLKSDELGIQLNTNRFEGGTHYVKLGAINPRTGVIGYSFIIITVSEGV